MAASIARLWGRLTGDRCGAALGARGRTLHSANVELAPTCADGLARSEVWTLEDLLSAAPARSRALDRYRIIGYPLSPLIGAPESTTLARAVFAPGPDDALPVVPLFEAVAATVS